MPARAVNERRGAVLAELAVALLLAGVAAVIGGGILVAAERRTRRDVWDDRSSQTAREVALLLSSEIAAALADSVTVRGDTALDLHAHVGASVVCARAGAVVVLPGAATSSGTPFSFWRQAPEPADLLVAWDGAGLGQWRAVRIDSAAAAPDGAGCSTAGGFRTAADSAARVAVTRVFLAGPLPPGVGAGAPVRVFRPVRWTLYRAADRTWSLGYRRCPRGACGSVQPTAGPLASAADSGLTFASPYPGVVTVDVRAPAPSGGAAPPLRITTAVRGWDRASP